MTTAVEPREHTIEARDLRFHYVEWGEADAPPIVLLHGLSSMCRIWDPLARAFQDRYRIIALDQRGHGDTSWPAGADYSTDDYVADLEALVEAAGLDRFVLVGLSMGGMNAIAYAARHPERVTHLVSVDIRPAFDYKRRLSYQLDKQVAEQGHLTFEDHETAFMARKLSNPFTPDESLRHHVRHLLKRLPDGNWTFKHDPRVSYHWRPTDLWEELPKVQAPVLIVRGGKSEVLPAEIAEPMRAAFSNAALVTIEESGHTVPEDAPQAFIEAVEGFLAR
ncbi:MAG: alpha/beta hydrolase [Chloroflexi bacterium]|nr:alpha/beta hydrolase [Chloroflexota bacterium]